MFIEVERRQDDGLKNERWVFNFTVYHLKSELRLQEYKSFTRPSKRHRYRIIKQWNMWNSESAKPTVPMDVSQEALGRVIDAIMVC